MGLVLLRLCVFLGLAYTVARWVRHFSDEADDPYEVLGIKPGADSAEVRAAYRQRLAEYHPDKTHQLGSELKELAGKKTRSIIEAYRKLTDSGAF
jgi:preprotein translocase subunit Sec63